MAEINWNDVAATTKTRGNKDSFTHKVIEGFLLRPDLPTKDIAARVRSAGQDGTESYAAVAVNGAKATLAVLMALEQPIKVNGKLYRLVPVQPAPALVKAPENVAADQPKTGTNNK